MDVNFTGYKNVGAMCLKSRDNSYGRMILVNAELTDDGDKDLTNFKEILNEYPNPLNKNSIKFGYINDTDLGEGFVLNEKGLPVKDANLKVFSKLAKLMTKMSEGAQPIVVEDAYLKNKADGLYDAILEGKDESVLRDKILSENSVILNSGRLSDIINKKMMDYFA